MMEVDEVAGGETSTERSTQQLKNPLERMRVRLAAENYNKPNNYQSLPDDSDDDKAAGLSDENCSLGYTFLYNLL